MTDSNESVRGRVVAWMRFHSDGGYEGPIADRECDEARKRSGVWEPLALQSDLAAAIARAEAAEAALRTLADIAAGSRTVNSLPHIERLARAAIAAQQAEGEDS